MIFSIRDPRSHKKFAPSLFIELSVSTATGTKRYLGLSSRHFSTLRLAACSAAAPAILDVLSRYEVAWVSGEVASQRRHFPACHAVKVTPSGRLASVRCKPSGSLVDGVLDKALQIMSFRYWRSWRPAATLLLHESPCIPKASTNEPQRQGWGSHSRRLPIRKATAALMTSFLIQRVHEDIGRAFSPSPEWTALEASNLARSWSLLQLYRRLDFVTSIPGFSQFFWIWLATPIGSTDLVASSHCSKADAFDWLSTMCVRTRMLICRSLVLAAYARKASDASEATERTPKPPSLTGRFAWHQLSSEIDRLRMFDKPSRVISSMSSSMGFPFKIFFILFNLFFFIFFIFLYFYFFQKFLNFFYFFKNFFF